MIDYTFRYDPSNGPSSPQPGTAEEARQTLMAGNRSFSEWMKSCRAADGEHKQFVTNASGLSSILSSEAHEFPTQKPFAVVVGCSDARVPTEMLFGQGFNDLFVVRNAGNVLGEVAMGSIDFTLLALRDSVRVIVSLGHTNCGAVKGAVKAYLNPGSFWSTDYSPELRAIFQEIFVAVRESDNMLREVWGPSAATMPGYEDALIECAVCLNAAHTALAIQQEVEETGHKGIDVLYGVYDVRVHQVCMPTLPYERSNADHVNLAHAPRRPEELAALAREIVTAFKPGNAAAPTGAVACGPHR
ncbi:carbonic anhydrase [Paludisphaera mucosa]|uniref:carbonic anhydrase n=1 Tax=Paludisphaera mucosa TaxID=3030827 RepID=A0ABT6FF63_9BACT|nr:carbonic anhydrase [Paludisphaera mucosa]MDG3006217.1 carbonic anhydrase [Paludisphaera mucosa]